MTLEMKFIFETKILNNHDYQYFQKIYFQYNYSVNRDFFSNNSSFVKFTVQEIIIFKY